MDQTRLETLAKKLQEGTLTDAEKLEYLQALNATLKGMRDILEKG